MSSPQTKTERLEAVLDIRTPDRDSARWRYWLMPIIALLLIPNNAEEIVYAESAIDATLSAGQLALWLTVFGIFFGQGLYIGAYGRAASRLRGFGRKLRLVCTIVFAVALPFFLASIGGDFAARQSGYSWMSGALVGGGVGLAFVLIICGRSFYRYRKVRDGSSAGG